MSPVHVSLTEDFRRFFKVSLATTPEQKQAVYRLRYRVYCEELQYEPADAFPDKAEFDEFDARSLHCLVIHRRSGLAAGCVRLVRSLDEHSHAPLPIEKHCGHSLDPATVGFMKHHRDLLTQEFWQQTKAQILNGKVEDFFPYPEELRFCNAFPVAATSSSAP